MLLSPSFVRGGIIYSGYGSVQHLGRGSFYQSAIAYLDTLNAYNQHKNGFLF